MRSEENRKKASVYFIVPAPEGISPGQRFRFEHYLSYLTELGIRYRVSNFYSLAGWKKLYTPGNKAGKALVVLRGLFKRLADLFRVISYRYVYVYREAAPVGPPFFEWVITKVLRKKAIYDFDDAIWVPVTSEYNKGASAFKSFGKVAKICKWSWKVSTGNAFLASYAGQFNKNVVVIPTVVNTDSIHNQVQNQETDKPLIGWTGTFSTIKYIDIVLPVLQKLEQQYDFTFVVIADKDPALPLKSYRFIKWSRESEVMDLLGFHIGLMPLNDDEISRGKCGFKAIQYMSLGIPALVSPVGVNSIIVDHGVNGFVCNTESEWQDCLERLLQDAQLRSSMGIAARKKIENNYSVKATRERFAGLFTD